MSIPRESVKPQMKNSVKSTKNPFLKQNADFVKIVPQDSYTINMPQVIAKRHTIKKKINTDNFSGKSDCTYDYLFRLNDEIQAAKRNHFNEMNLDLFNYKSIKPFLSYYEHSAWRIIYDDEHEYPEENKIIGICSSSDGSIIVSYSENSIKGRKISQEACSISSQTWANRKIVVGSISSDGSNLVIGSEEGYTSTWKYLEQLEILNEYSDHEGKIISVSMSRGGYKFASCGVDRNIKIRNPLGDKLATTFQNTTPLILIMIHPNDIHLLSADETNTIKIRHIDSGDVITSLLHEGIIKNFSTDESGMFLLSCMENRVRIWTIGSLESEQFENNYYDLENHSNIVTKAVISPNQKKILTISKDSILRIWDTENWEEDFFLTTENEFSDAVISDHSFMFTVNNSLFTKSKSLKIKSRRSEFPALKKIGDIAFDSKDEKVALACDDQDIRIIHLSEKMKDFDFILSKHSETVTCVRFNQYDDNCLVSGSKDKLIILWDLKTRNCRRIYEMCEDAIKHVLFAKNGYNLISCCKKDIIKLWSFEQSFPIRSLISEPQKHFTLAYETKTNVLVTGGSEKVLSFWTFDEGFSEYKLQEEKEFMQEIISIECNPNSDLYTYAVSFQNGLVRIFSSRLLQTKEIVSSSNTFNKVIFHPSSTKLILTTHQDTVEEWCIESGVRVNMIENRFPSSEHVICINNKGNLLALSSRDHQFRFINLLDEVYFLGLYKSYQFLKKNPLQALMESQLQKSTFEKMALSYEIFPLEMNLLSWLIYLNDIAILEKFYELCKYFETYPSQKSDWKGVFPIQSVVKKQNKEMIVIVLGLYFRSIPKIGCARYITPDLLTNLIDLNIDTVSELLTSRLIPIKASTNPWMLGDKGYFHSILCYEFDGSSTRPTKEKNVKRIISFFYRVLRLKKKKPIQIPAQCFILDIKGILSPSNNFLWNMTNYNSLHRVFQNEAFLALLELKWNHYVRNNFLKDTFFFFNFLLICTLNSILILPERIDEMKNSRTKSYSKTAYSMDLLIFLYIPFLAKREISQIKKMGYKQYLSSFWNYLDLLTIAFGTLAIPVDLFQLRNRYEDQTYVIEPLKVFHSFLLIITWIRVLKMARGFEGSSFMIHVFSAIFTNYVIKWFIFWIFWLLVGLSFVVYILNIGDLPNSTFSNFKAFYYLLLGDFDDYRDIYEGTTHFPNLLWFILMLTSIVMTIIMMNLLIAIISEIYTKVKDVEEAAFIFEKTMIINEVDKQYSDVVKKKECFNEDDYLILSKSGQKMDIPHVMGQSHNFLPKKVGNIRDKGKEYNENDLVLKIKTLEKKLEHFEKIKTNANTTSVENFKLKTMDNKDTKRINTLKTFLDKLAFVSPDANYDSNSPKQNIIQNIEKNKNALLASLDIDRAFFDSDHDIKPDELNLISSNNLLKGKPKNHRNEFNNDCGYSTENKSTFYPPNSFKKLS